MHARHRANLVENATVLVFGAGAVGLLCAAVSKAAGAKAVIIADIQPERVDFAVANGYADAAVTVPMTRTTTIEEGLAFAKEVAAVVKAVEVNGHVGEVDAVYECTGVQSCLQSSIYVSYLESTRPSNASGRRLRRVPGNSTRRQDHDHRHGQPRADASNIGRIPTRSRLDWRLSLRKQLSGGYRAAVQQAARAAGSQHANHSTVQGDG